MVNKVGVKIFEEDLASEMETRLDHSRAFVSVKFSSVQFIHSIVSDSCDLMDCSTPGFPVHHQFPEFTQTHVHPLSSSLFSPQSFPASRSSPVSGLFTSGGQSIGDSALPSILPKYIQGWFPLGLTGLISLLCKGLSRVSTTVQKQFFSDQRKNKKCEVDKN